MTNRFADPLRRYLDRRNSQLRTSQFIRGVADHLDPDPPQFSRRSLENYSGWHESVWDNSNWENTNTTTIISDMNSYHRYLYGASLHAQPVPHNEHCVEVDGRWFCSINCKHKK